jgi:hypothetical protein
MASPVRLRRVTAVPNRTVNFDITRMDVNEQVRIMKFYFVRQLSPSAIQL